MLTIRNDLSGQPSILGWLGVRILVLEGIVCGAHGAPVLINGSMSWRAIVL
jgi:hypothetical protein